MLQALKTQYLLCYFIFMVAKRGKEYCHFPLYRQRNRGCEILSNFLHSYNHSELEYEIQHI